MPYIYEDRTKCSYCKSQVSKSEGQTVIFQVKGDLSKQFCNMECYNNYRDNNEQSKGAEAEAFFAVLLITLLVGGCFSSMN